MKKLSTKKFTNKLAKYGALTAAIAGVADAAGQVVYTDVDPDFDGALTDVFDVDFDGDGNIDISVVQSNNGNYELVMADPGIGNGVLATSNGGYFYASNIPTSDSIGAGAAGTFRSFGSFCAGVGYAGSMFCGTGEGYIGVEFNVSGATHYGWVRCDVANSSGYTVLDFAYESTADAAIAAGDMGAVGIENAKFSGFTYFTDVNGQLNLNASVPMTSVEVYDVLGKQVINSSLSSSNEMVDLNALSSGAYVVTVAINSERKTFKIAK